MSSKECKNLILQNLKNILQPLGYKKNGNIFSLATDDLTYYIGLQSSQSSTASILKVTVNTEIASAIISKLDNTSLPIRQQRHYEQRIGFYLEPGSDRWWVCESMESTGKAVAEIKEIIQTKILTHFASLKITEDLISLWRTGKSPGLTDRRRKDFLELMA